MVYRGRGRGGGARGRGRGGDRNFRGVQNAIPDDADALTIHLHSLHGKGYGSYKSLLKSWEFPHSSTLAFTRIQSDAYAQPSSAYISMPLAQTGFSNTLYSNGIRTIAFCDFIIRKFCRVAYENGLHFRHSSGGWGGVKGGDITIYKPGQHVLERSACYMKDDSLIVQFYFGLPAKGRSITGPLAAKCMIMLKGVMVQCMRAGADLDDIKIHVDCVEEQEELRSLLSQNGLIGFVINGAVLPRESGANDGPMKGESVVKFESPPEMENSITLKSGKEFTGMGIKPGVTLIVGGGFHGKSTLLSALKVGVYNHIPSDGREFCVMLPETVYNRSEDGRSVTDVDISLFLGPLPQNLDTTHFQTGDASGSTSQAASLIEAFEAGCKVLLIDEDLSATNLMTRDRRMALLVQNEPITPVLYRLKSLSSQGISTILVVGSAGDFFDVCDCVIRMDNYLASEVTKQAWDIAKADPSGVEFPEEEPLNHSHRTFDSTSIKDIIRAGKGYTKVGTIDTIQIGAAQIDLSAVSQLVEVGQTRAIGKILEGMGGGEDMDVILQNWSTLREARGDLVRPRRFEVLATLNRMRGVKVAVSRPNKKQRMS